MHFLRRLGLLALLALLIYWIARSPAHADHVAHSLAAGISQAANSAANFLDGL